MAGRRPEGHPLDHPEEIGGGQDDAERGNRRGDLVPEKSADQDQKLPHKTVRARQSQGGEGENHQTGGVAWHRIGQAEIVGDHAAVGAFVNDSHAEEQRAGGDPVVDHLHERALDALGV